MFRCVILLMLSLAAISCSQTTRPGQSPALPRLAGKASTNGGAGEYRIPIELPDGGPSFKPNISLTYNSRAGNGEMGMGWYVTAGSSIFRCPFILDGDGFMRPVQYAPDDRLCIDGTKLVLAKGTYGKDGSVYVPEADSGIYVKLLGDLNSPDSAFVTVDNDANINIYKVPIVYEGVDAPLTWLLTTSIRKDGQAIEYRYERRPFAEALLREIRYGGKYSASDKKLTHGDYFVRFDFGPRSDRDSSFLAGGEFRSTQLLNEIVAGTTHGTGESIGLKYTFAYRPSLATGRSLLVSAQACRDVAMQVGCTLPTRFKWQDSKLYFKSPEPIAATPDGKILASAWEPGKAAPSLGAYFAGDDYNADGRRDVVARSADGLVTVFVLQPGGQVLDRVDVSKAMTIDQTRPPFGGMSVRHLGNAELIGGVDQRLAVADWSGNSFAPPAVTSMPYTGDALLTDASGNGQSDVVIGGHVGKGYVVTLYRNLDSSNKKIAFSPGETVARLDSKPDMRLAPGIAIAGFDRTILVYEGDQAAYVIAFSSEAGGKLKTSRFLMSDVGVSSEAISQGFVFADINGDGFDDIVYTAKSGNLMLQLNDGIRFEPPIDTNVRDVRTKVGRAGTLVFDVEGSGRNEIVFPSRRLVDFCVKPAAGGLACSNSIAQTNPKMDLGIYEYDAIDFQLDATGNCVPRVLSNMHLVGQANRAQPADIYGDGYSNLISPFDRGVENGWFKGPNDTLLECPPDFGCGLHLTQQSRMKRNDRSDVASDVLIGANMAPGSDVRWTYYPISNPFRHLYSVPALDSPERYLDSRRYYFTSSMYVVGEMASHDAAGTDEYRFEYGGGEYSTAGRGFEGFKWIVLDDTAQRKKFGSWFGQDGPYVGMLERSWSEEESDHENDYLHGSPGNHYLTFEKYNLGCTGPKDNAVTLRYHCKVGELPNFSAYRKQ